MKRYLFIFVLCLGAFSLQAQDTTMVRSGVWIRRNSDCGCQRRPVNDYDGLNSLRARLANPAWNGVKGSLSTGLKLEDGKIKPLVDLKRSEDSVELERSYVAITEDGFSLHNPYLEEMERGEVCVGSPLLVFFRLAGTYVTDSLQLLNVYAIADLAIAENLRVRVTGAADSVTGYPEKNTALARARAEHVASIIKNRGVPEERIEILSEGGISLYDPIPANRNCRIELLMQ